MKGLNKFAKKIHKQNKEKGFYVSKQNVAQSMMLVVCEIAEAVEADRKGDFADLDAFEADPERIFEVHIKDTFQDEIADAIIRLLDYCGATNLDIEKHIEYKLEFNKTRAYKHGKRY